MPDLLSQKFAALADPTRRAMLAKLSEGQASVNEIARPFLRKMSLPAVTKHLKVLECAGLVIKTPDAQRRVCELNPDGFKEAMDYMDEYRQMWEASLDRLGEYIESIADKNKSVKRKKKDGH